MTDERRANYRVSAGLKDFSVAVAWIGEDYVDANLIDLSATGAAISLALSARQAADPAGETTVVHLRFDIPGAGTVADIPARIRHERHDDGECFLGIEIVDWGRLHELLPPKLFALFNRRRDFRVELPKDPPVSASVQIGDRFETAVMVDISASGCLLLLPLPTPDLDSNVRMKFELPGGARAYELRGRVRSSAVKGSSARCGISFDEQESDEQRRGISHYVMERQREILRAGR